MIVVTVLAILMSIGVPGYQCALRIARITKAKQELRVLSMAIDQHRAVNAGELPLTLYQVGYGGRLDPWGLPYCYLNYAAGTGDGLTWAVSVGMVDPAAVGGQGTTSGSGNGGGNSGGNSGKNGGSGNNGGNNGGIGAVVSEVAKTLQGAELAAFISSLHEGTTTVMVGVPVESTRRRDKYMFPLNTDYDLFSLGPDGRTAASLSHAMALDDVIRANDGGFFGVAADY